MSLYDLKDEKQAKEYLKNLGIEYRYQCFEEKNPEGCHRLADFEEVFRKNFEKAAKVFRSNCDDFQYGHSCFKYGNFRLTGKGGEEKSSAAAFDYYNKGCSAGYMPACNNLAFLYGGGQISHKKDYKQAAEYFDKACKGGNYISCFHLSGLYISGKENVIKKDMKKAFDYSKLGCDGGIFPACVNLSQMYAKGEGVEKDEKRAEFYKNKAKDLHKQHTEKQQNVTFGQ
ncbi:cytochrome c oxidase assembly factor 7-like [Tubulanus polymorphus]|uniref:cytochrome c oxidase assembly factor 7-like n=1 Tax=Tubulanus polymorphus TaxID=672921 RepID=UPI003DA47617